MSNGETWFVGGGLIRRIFVGSGEGYLKHPEEEGPLTPENIAVNLEAIQATDSFHIPNSLTEDLEYLIDRYQT